MKKLLVFFLLLALVVPALGAVGKTNPATPEASTKTKVVSTFKDLTAKDPAYPYVMRMVASYEVLSGYPDGTFRGSKSITRAEFSKIITSAVAYQERSGRTVLAAKTPTMDVKFKDLNAKHWAYPYVAELVNKYKLLTGYPDGTYKPKKSVTRYEVATVLGKMLKLFDLPTPALASGESVPADVKATHWAAKDVQLLVKLGIMGVDKKKNFYGAREATRSEVAVSMAKLIELPPAEVKVEPPSQIEKAATSRAYISGGWGNVYESQSGTDNWRSFHASATYGDIFQIWRFSGNYEITGKYGYNQIVYIVPDGGGGVAAGINNENRYELELNTVYPVVRFYGINGKLLLGAKYINLSNPTAPSSFTGFNAGVATSAKILGRDFLLRAFYSLPLARAAVSPSVLGQPSHLFDYEAALDAVLFNYPVLIGFSGETMTLTNGGTRFYNSVFARYFLL